MNNTRKHSAFLVLGIFLLGACMRTPVTSIPSIVGEIAASFHVATTSLGILTTIPLICFGLVAVVVPMIGQKLGNELTIAIALLILFAGSWLRVLNYASLMIGTLLVGVRLAGLEGLEKRLPSQLSGGQQQRVALARMMIGEPEAILLDEPFSALDGYLKDVLQREMQDFLKDYPGDMILVTHSRDEAYKFCRELSIVHEGRILVTGETKQLFERPGLLEAAKLTGCKNFSRAERLGPHEIYAADWKMKLHTEENVDMDITHVGIRGHWIRPESEPGENCMAVQVDQYIETTFEHQYMIRNKAEENAAGLWWMRPKNSFTEDPDKDLPEYLYFPPEHLMLLK